jgi:hypothetical protein
LVVLARNEDASVGISLHRQFAVFSVIYSEKQRLASLLFIGRCFPNLEFLRFSPTGSLFFSGLSARSAAPFRGTDRPNGV